jgi:hypothetical protein
MRSDRAKTASTFLFVLTQGAWFLLFFYLSHSTGGVRAGFSSPFSFGDTAFASAGYQRGFLALCMKRAFLFFFCLLLHLETYFCFFTWSVGSASKHARQARVAPCSFQRLESLLLLGYWLMHARVDVPGTKGLFGSVREGFPFGMGLLSLRDSMVGGGWLDGWG